MEKLIYSKRAFTLVEILIVVAIIGLLAFISIPNLIKARQRAESNNRVANIRTIDAAVEQWMLETGGLTNELDSMLARQPWGNVAYQIPKSVPLGSNAVVSMRLSPHKTFEELATHFNTNLHAFLKVEEVQFGKKMKASLVSDPDTMTIIAKESEIQPVSYRDDTTWSWYISPKRPGKYWMHLKLEILVLMDGETLPYPAITHEDTVLVEATKTQTAMAFIKQYWQSTLFTTLMLAVILAFGRRIQRWWTTRKQKQADAGREIGFNVSKKKKDQ